MGIAKTAEPFICGGSAATFASCVIHPIDLAKVGESLSTLSASHLNEVFSSSIVSFLYWHLMVV